MFDHGINPEYEAALAAAREKTKNKQMLDKQKTVDMITAHSDCPSTDIRKIWAKPHRTELDHQRLVFLHNLLSEDDQAKNLMNLARSFDAMKISYDRLLAAYERVTF